MSGAWRRTCCGPNLRPETLSLRIVRCDRRRAPAELPSLGRTRSGRLRPPSAGGPRGRSRVVAGSAAAGLGAPRGWPRSSRRSIARICSARSSRWCCLRARPSTCCGAQVAPLEAVVGGGAIGYRRSRSRRGARRSGSARSTGHSWPSSPSSPSARSARSTTPIGFASFSSGAPSGSSSTRSPRTSTGRRDLSLLLVALAAATLVEASVALFEYVIAGPSASRSLGGAIVYPLPEGTLGHPNALAQFLVLAGLAVLALALAEQRSAASLGLATAGAGHARPRRDVLARFVDRPRRRRLRLPRRAKDARPRPRRRRCRGLGAAAAALLGSGGDRRSDLVALQGEARGLYDFRLELIERAARIAADTSA